MSQEKGHLIDDMTSRFEHVGPSSAVLDPCDMSVLCTRICTCSRVANHIRFTALAYGCKQRVDLSHKAPRVAYTSHIHQADSSLKIQELTAQQPAAERRHTACGTRRLAPAQPTMAQELTSSLQLAPGLLQTGLQLSLSRMHWGLPAAALQPLGLKPAALQRTWGLFPAALQLLIPLLSSKDHLSQLSRYHISIA